MKHVACDLAVKSVWKELIVSIPMGPSQLHRRFGVRKAQDIIKNLKAIYISHLHVDHHMGFIGLVSYRYGVLPYNGHNRASAEKKFDPALIVALMAW